MNLSAATIRDRSSALLDWWGSELTGMLPAWLRDSGPRVSRLPIVSLEKDAVRLLELKPLADGSWRTVFPPTSTIGDLLDGMRRTANDRLPSGVTLRFPHSYCFVRAVELPIAATADFEQLLMHDMERATPFKRDEVYSAFVFDTRAPSQKSKTRLRQYIVKRSLLSTTIAEFQQHGLPVEQIECWDENGTAPLTAEFRMTDDNPARRDNNLAVMLTSISLLAVALAGFAAYTYLNRLETTLARVEAQSLDARTAAARRRSTELSARATEATLAALNGLEQSTVPKLAVIDELSRLLPDSAWVTDLRIGPDTADIKGLAGSTVALLRVLETSPLFVDATSTAAVTFDTRENKERFSLHVRLRQTLLAKQKTDGSGQ